MLKAPLAASRTIFVALNLFIFCTAAPALLAHVKWYSNFSYGDRPLTLAEAVTPTFLLLAVAAMLVMSLMVVLDYKLQNTPYFRRMDERLGKIGNYSQIVLRVGTGAVMLLSWQANAMLVPELDHAADWIGWYQFGLALLLLFQRTTPLAGLGLIGLFTFGIIEFGMLHMLDYLLYAGVGYFLLAGENTNAKFQSSALPALYFTLGFSLCWVALEKVVYPEWGLSVLEQQSHLAMGLDLSLFLTASAFVEFCLGYLLIIGLLQRPISLFITLVFFMTTLTFGKLEVIGHTLIHAALIVLLIEGPGKRYSAPYTFHQKPVQRVVFAALNFAVLLTLMLVPYVNSAQTAYREFVVRGGHNHHGKVEVANTADIPTVKLIIQSINDAGITLRIDVKNFRFAPTAADGVHVEGEGHAHLYVDGRKVARVYGPWYHLPPLPPGSHEIRVTLNSNDHREYTVGGIRIEDQQTVEVL